MSVIEEVDAPMSNGATPPLDQPDDAILDSLRQTIETKQARADALQYELDQIVPEIRRYQRALALLTGEVKPGKTPGPRKRTVPSKLAEERLGPIREAIIAFAEDHEEFRQVDIRGAMSEEVRSSVMAQAFEQLRQDQVIRFARQDGISKYFRLTRSAANS